MTTRHSDQIDAPALHAAFDTEGYCLIENAMSAELLGVVRERLERQATAERARAIAYENPGHRDNQWVNMLLNKGDAFHRLALDADICAIVTHALGPDWLFSCCDAQIKHPGAGAMRLHTDQWWMPPPQAPGAVATRPGAMTRDDAGAIDPRPAQRPIAARAVANVMWMVSDFTEANGATRVVPGSHLSGAQPDPESSDRIETIAVEGEAGSAFVFDGRLWHGAGANTTGSTRYGVTCAYCGPQFRPLENYTRGMRPEVLERASPALLRRLGFSAWSTYGHTGDPGAPLSVAGDDAIGEL